MALLSKLFKKKPNLAKVECNVVLNYETKDKMGVQELHVAMDRWQKTFGADEQESMLFNDSDSTTSKFSVYFSPYTAECFIKYYKNLIDQNIPVPHTGGNVFKPIPVNLNIFYNTFDNKTVKVGTGEYRHILDSSNKLESYKGNKRAPFITNNFTSILYSMNRIIFFYNYTSAQLVNQDDPEHEYKINKKLAIYIRQVYCAQHKLQPAQIATIPSYHDFESQNIKSVYIPALVSPNVTFKMSKNKSASASSSKRSKNSSQGLSNVSHSAKASSSSSTSASNSSIDSSASEARRSKSRSAVVFARRSSLKSKSSQQSAETHSNMSESASVSASQNKLIKSMEASLMTETHKSQSQSQASKASSSSAKSSMPKSSSASSSSSKDESITVHHQQSSATSQPSTQSASQPSNDLVDPREFAKTKWPRTNKPAVIRGAIQLMLDRDPNLLHKQVPFKRFHVDKKMPAPVPIQKAIKSGNLDNQEYVVRMDNQFKRAANEIIDNRSKALELSYDTVLSDLLLGAYEKIDAKISKLLANKSDDRGLTKSAQHYYNVHFKQLNKKLQQGRKTELDTINKSLFNDYKSKKQAHDAKINARYDKAQRNLGIKVNEMTNDVFYKAHDQRNAELDKQIDALRKSDLHKIHLQIKTHNNEFLHKSSQASQYLFTMLEKRLYSEHDKAVAVVSRLINKQIKLNESKQNLHEAQVEMVRSKTNRQANAKWTKQEHKLQTYINTLSSQVGNYMNQLTDIKAKSQQDKNKLNATILKNHSLQSELKNSQMLLQHNQEEISKGHDNAVKYQLAQQKNQSQQAELASQRANFNSQNNALLAESSLDSVSASRSASYSASARVSSAQSSIMAKNASNQTKMFVLQHDLESAQSASSANTNSIMNLRSHMLSSQQSFQSYRDSIAKSVAEKNASVASFMAQGSVGDASAKLSASRSAQAQIKANNSAVARDNARYEARMESMQAQLDSAQQTSQANNGGISSLRATLNSENASFHNYRLSVSTSISMANESIANRDASINSSIAAHNANYRQDIATYQMALNKASSNNVDTSSAANQIKNMQASFNAYKTSVADSDAKQDALNKARQQSASTQEAQYQKAMGSLMATTQSTSKADNHTMSVEMKLNSVRTAFSEYQSNESNAQSLHDAAVSGRASQQMDVYKAELAQMNSNQAKMQMAQSQATQTNNSSASATVSSKLASYKSNANTLQSTFNSYRASVSASNSVEQSKVSASNSATSSVMSSATVHKSSRNDTQSQSKSEQHQEMHNFQTYNPEDDEVEVQRIEHDKKMREQIKRLKERANQKSGNQGQKKKPWWKF